MKLIQFLKEGHFKYFFILTHNLMCNQKRTPYISIELHLNCQTLFNNWKCSFLRIMKSELLFSRNLKVQNNNSISSVTSFWSRLDLLKMRLKSISRTNSSRDNRLSSFAGFSFRFLGIGLVSSLYLSGTLSLLSKCTVPFAMMDGWLIH